MRVRTLIMTLLVAAQPAASFGAPSPVNPGDVNKALKPVKRAQESVAQERSIEPVVVKGAHFPTWSAGPDPTLREPQPANVGAGSRCRAPGQNQWDPADDGDHNCYQDSRLPRNPREGAPVGSLIGFRWDGDSFTEIPFQVDERFTRYLTNNASGFAPYSSMDAHNTYAFDREGFRFTDNEPDDVCEPRARQDPPGSGRRPTTTPDPVVGLDDDDELVWMWSDGGGPAPPGAPLPEGVKELAEVAVADPADPGNRRFAYVGLSAGERVPAFTAADSPYVRYARDSGPNRLGADLFVYSQSSYDGYGAAPKGPFCDPATGSPVLDGSGAYRIEQRRPLDTAWVRTPRYAFRYDGRWLMTELHVSDAGDWTYGPDIIDRWKARAFQQDPSSETPCCGYEEEDTNWGGSSILMGERAGPVRVIRETWGADSSTNNARREVFYRDMFVWGDALRVHPVPPLDGIYSQWDFNAGRVNTYFNPVRAEGVTIDGRNDEVFGNLDDPCNPRYDGRGSTIDETFRAAYRASGACAAPYHQSVDVVDPTHSGPQALQWEQVSGPHGSVVLRTAIRDHSPGGDAQSLFAVPYYRDDSCFDDGTGTDPGPRRRERSATEPETYRLPGGTEDLARRCWQPSDGLPDPAFVAEDDEPGDERYFQGDIGTIGLHLLLVAESDNAFMPLPLTEIVSEQRVVVLPGQQPNVGERYGRWVEQPLLVSARTFG